MVGRIYVFGALVAAPLGAYIQYFEERMKEPRSFTILAAVDAVLLMSTTAIAFAFILNGKVQQHRSWMTRSFAVALVFLEGRVVLGITNWENTRPELNEAVIWACIAFSILAADIVLQWQEMRRSRPAVAKARVAQLAMR